MIGRAAYGGHAVGNVVNGADQYVAAGNLDMSWDFGRRDGRLTISDFDSRTFSGTMNAAAGSPNFSGALAGADIAGGATGSFVDGPRGFGASGAAGGVMGAFAVDGSGFSATGIFAGEILPP